jgi:GH25 family lysozyme M1 (1,4-beta-N-acetylmuramidase)
MDEKDRAMLNVVVDISHYQATVDFVKLRASGVVGIIHKASEGDSFTDSLYDEHRAKAKAAGFLWGAYHLGTNGDAGAQVSNFLKSAKPDDDTLLCLQWQDLGGGSSGGSSSSSVDDTHPQGEIDGGTTEPTPTPQSNSSEGELEEGKQEPVDSGSSSGGTDTGKTMTLEQVRSFVVACEKQSGRYPVLCSGAVAKRELAEGIDPVLQNCPFWIIDYNDHPADVPLTFGKTFALWQYTNGEIGLEPHEAIGIGPCFRDRFNGGEGELAKFWVGVDPARAAKVIGGGPLAGRHGSGDRDSESGSTSGRETETESTGRGSEPESTEHKRW